MNNRLHHYLSFFIVILCLASFCALADPGDNNENLSPESQAPDNTTHVIPVSTTITTTQPTTLTTQNSTLEPATNPPTARPTPEYTTSTASTTAPSPTITSTPIITPSHGKSDVHKSAPHSLGSADTYSPDEVIVRFKPEKVADKENKGQVISNAHKAVSATVVDDYDKKGLSGMQVVKLKEGKNIEDAITEYSNNPDVLYAVPNYRINLFQSPDDPSFTMQWALPLMKTPEAWDQATGSDSVIIAILDTGIDYNHPDLAANIWTNPMEIIGNTIDEDGNGFIDDVRGWNFVGENNDPMDINGHGTACAGIAGATGNNGIGIAGVMWDSRILPLKVIGDSGYGYESDAIDAILYADQIDADIISISWGSYGESQALKDAIEDFPGLVVCAAGNSAQDNDLYPVYPASYSSGNIIAVTATDQNDEIASFANYGVGSVDITAPGVGIYSIIPGSGYDIRSGTSMAAPYVAGVAGLVLSEHGNLEGAELVEILTQSSDPLASLEGSISSSGRINAENALLLAGGYNSNIPVQTHVTPSPILSPTTSVTVTSTPTPVIPDDGPQIAPLNSEFVQYLQSPTLSEGGDDTQGLGWAPSPVNRSSMQGQVMQLSENAVLSLPTSYDLRDENRVTPVKNQGSCGSCWAFATYGSAESVLMPGEQWDFSENNLKNTHGYDWTSCYGGNYDMSTAYLTRWSGPVTEAADPYNPLSSYSPPGLQPVKHVQDVLYIPDRAGSLDNDNIKTAIMTYGGVGTAFYWSSVNYSSSTRTYYYSGTSPSNHAVTIMGWDDNKVVSGAPGNGAFLIKNSWGTGWGDGGYFWISYYDSKLGRSSNAVFLSEPTNNFDYIYQYDPLGWVSSVGYYSTTYWGANVFTSARNEQLRAVGFYAASPNTGYEIYVYKNPVNGPVSQSGPASSQTGTIAIPGYLTIPLDTPVTLNSGEKFSIVVKFTTPTSNYPVAMERPLSGYSSGAVAAAGQSYISGDGASWHDLTTVSENTNVCIKGYTTENFPPIAVFTVNTTMGKNPLSVLFTDLSASNPTSWNWDFGDGGTSTERNPQYTYLDIGVYTVTLTATNEFGSDEETKPGYVMATEFDNTKIAVFRPSTGDWSFDYDLNGVSDRTFHWASSVDTPITGDFNGDGKTDIGVFRPSTGYWYFDYNLDGFSNKSFRWGTSGDQPLVGDWNGNGFDGIGIFRPSTGYWYFDYNLDGFSDRSFRWGTNGDQPLVGDWNGNGLDGVGIFRPSSGYWYFDYDLNGVSNKSFRWGTNGDKPLVGDWNGNGLDGIGIFRPSSGYWYFDYDLNGASDKILHWASSVDTPLTGDFNGDGLTDIGVFRPSAGNWYFDFNLNGVSDRTFHWASNLDTPLVGYWS